MQAIRQHAFGGPQELRLETVPDPHPADGQVRIRVESAGVHLIDTLVRQGKAGGSRPISKLPMRPGGDVAGVIDEVARDVDGHLLARRVVTDLGAASGGYAELALARAASLHVLPAGLDADQAVTMVGIGRTTMAILEVAAPTADDVVVVTGAAGASARCFSKRLVPPARQSSGLPAEARRSSWCAGSAPRQRSITAKQDGWRRCAPAFGARPVTLALDGVGGRIGRATLELFGVGGRLVMFGSSSGQLTRLFAGDLFARGIAASAAIGARLMRRPGGLHPLERRALQAAAEGRLVPVVGQRFALADAAAAHQAIESRSTTGKTVLRPATPS
jgi:NADPH2:quinone reductase